jgi:hypothetical protein
MKRNIAQFALEQESTPGTAETLAAADVLVRLREGYTIMPEYGLIDLQEISSVSSKTAAVIGRRSVTFGVTYVLRGPGSTTVDPAIAPLWESAMLVGAEAYTIAIGAIAGGPYVAGEIVTGGTSGNTVMVLQQTATGAASLPHIQITGALQSGEVLTGGTSGATSTSSAAPANVGYGFRPADWSDEDGSGHHATCEGLVDGYYWQGRGCLSDLQWEFTNGGPCIVTQNFVGSLSAKGDKVLYTVAAYPEASVVVPKFLDAGLWIDSVKPTGINQVTITWPTNPTFVEDANDTADDGVLYADYDRQLPTVTLEIDQVATTTYDYFDSLEDGAPVRFELTYGATSGAIWTFAAPAAQIRSIGTGDREPNRATFQVELGLTGANNEELLIWQH